MGRRVAIVLALLLVATLPVAAADAHVERRLVSFHGDAPHEGGLLGEARVLESFAFARIALVEASLPALTRLALLPEVAGVYPEESLSFALDRIRPVVGAVPPARGAAWPTGSGVTIAFVDSGIDFSHPGFADRIAANMRITKSGFVGEGGGDDDGHGTHVAGIAAGSGAESERGRLSGFAPGSRLVGIDISDSFTTTSAVRAFEWIHDHRHEHGIRVVANSWGREKPDAHYDADDPVIRASDALVADGLVVVFSAGNRGRDGAATLTTEATNPNVLTVGAASTTGRVEPYSSRGPAIDGARAPLAWTKPDIVAPGSAILSTRSTELAPPGSTGEARYYTVMNGTSMAAPQVAAAAALLIQTDPSLTPAMVQAILQRSARDAGTPGVDDETGHGMLDVSGALDALAAVRAGKREVVVERHVPVHHEGRVSGAQGIVLLSGSAPAVPAKAVEIPIALPPGAVAADLWFNWSGRGAFEVTLSGPHGAWRFEPQGGQSLRLAHPAREGAYRVVIKPTELAADTRYALEGALIVHDTRVVDAPTELHARGGPLSQGGFFVPQTPIGRAMAIIAGEPGFVLSFVVALSLAGSVFALKRRAKP